jgi:hypothetical protein
LGYDPHGIGIVLMPIRIRVWIGIIMVSPLISPYCAGCGGVLSHVSEGVLLAMPGHLASRPLLHRERRSPGGAGRRYATHKIIIKKIVKFLLNCIRINVAEKNSDPG